MTRNLTPVGTAPLRIVTRYQEADSYLAGALHVRQGWHWHWEALSPTDEALSSVIKGPFPTEEAALDNAATELARGNVARNARIEELRGRRLELLHLRDMRDGAERNDVQDDIHAIDDELERLAAD